MLSVLAIVILLDDADVNAFCRSYPQADICWPSPPPSLDPVDREVANMRTASSSSCA